MNIILMGPSASGKGTQAKLLAKKLGISHISTGEIFREEFKKDTPEAKRARSYYYEGKFVPSELVFRLLKPCLNSAQGGFILDGFPRIPDQSPMLDEYLRQKGQKVDFYFVLEVSDEEAIRRHLFRVADEGRREAQDEEGETKVIRERLAEYYRNVNPILEHYEKQGVVVRVNGEQSIEKIHQEILSKLNFH